MYTKAMLAVVRELAEVKRGFERWRRSRKRRGQIPQRLWQLAAEAATRHGVHRTARTLRLNPTTLKQWVKTVAKDQASKEESRFVEFPWPGPTAVSECILEAEDRAGKTLRIHLKGQATAQAAPLGRLLWRDEE
jgi:hypothetical protein